MVNDKYCECLLVKDVGSPRYEPTPLLSVAGRVQQKMDILTTMLDAYNGCGQSRDRARKTFSWRFQFTIGRTVRALTTEVGNKTWCTPHNFLPGKGVYSLAMGVLKDPLSGGKQEQQKAIYVEAIELMKLVDASYVAHGDFVLQVALMTDPKRHYCKRHTDDDDITFQYGVGLGNYRGGELVTWDSSGARQAPIDMRRRLVRLDGRLPHMVGSFKGTRYSLYYYKLYDRSISERQPIYEPAHVL